MSHRLPGSRVSLPLKLAALAGAISAGVWVALAIAAERTAGATRLAWFAVIMAPPTIVVFLVSRYVVDRVTAPLIEAYRRVGAGDFAARLPPMTAGAEFIRFRDAFAAMARELERSTQALRQADVERRQLFADLAHELATPTTTLLGIAHALHEGRGDREVLLALLDQESARLDRLIADVRELAHLEDPALSLERTRCDLGELAERAVERARLVTAGAAMRCAATPVPAEVDPVRIDQILVNLIGNAVRHAPSGTIAVRVGRVADTAELVVEDSGPGVPDELLPALGRRLVRLDPSRDRETGGHGLGLSIVRAIVDRHGGTVSFGRAGLGGLAVTVRLPVAATTTAARGSSSSPTSDR